MTGRHIKRDKTKPYKRIALVVSVCLILLWAFLGTGASLAWFVDTSETVENIFNMAEFDLLLEYRDENGMYQEVTSQTSVFDDEALYEPGYTQVVYLRATNCGNVPFDCKAAITVTDYNIGYDEYGRSINLQDYLRFGALCAPDEATIEGQLLNREMAVSHATSRLNNYPPMEDIAVEAGGELYIALVLHMPVDVNNRANYRGDSIPTVNLGLTVTATQQN